MPRFTWLLPVAAAYGAYHYLGTQSLAYIQSPFSTPPPSPANSTTGGFSRHIVAIGDLHGDLPNALKVLHFSGVTSPSGHWLPDNGVDFLVQTGDIIDRGDDTIALFTLMDTLRAEAAQEGSTVLSHLGNHEWMNAIGDWRYVYPSEIKTFGGVKERQDMLGSKGTIGKSWSGNYTTASRLPLHPSIGDPNTPYLGDDKSALSHAAVSFVHGGLSPTYSGLTPFPSKINQLSTSLLHKLLSREQQPPPHPPNPYPGLPPSTTPQEDELYGANGPLWYRGWALDTEENVCRDVEAVLEKTGTRRMIMGHTPDFHNIQSRCGGKIIIIDTGISHAYGGVLSALSIHYTLEPKENEEGIWVEKEVVSALYETHTEVVSSEERQVVGDFSL